VKTVLALNAPWPTKPEEKPKAAAKKKTPKEPSRRSETDKKFEEWASKNKGTINEIH
jgi:hypothetical protein